MTFSCGQGKEDELKLKGFEKRYNEITSVSPEDMNLRFIEICENADETSPFSKYTPEMMEHQFATNYRVASDQLAKLIVDILFYKKMIPTKNVKPEELKSLVKRLNNKKDGFNAIIVKSFDLLVQYKSKEINL
jgi:hypothetical protein